MRCSKKHNTNVGKKPKKHETSKIDVDINLIHTLGYLKSRQLSTSLK
jgi:hypothetical protein